MSTMHGKRRSSLTAVLLGSVIGAASVAIGAAPALAAVEAETAFVFNTLSFLVHGFLVLWMAAGFAALESGMVRTKSVSTILLKNVTLFSIAGIAFYLVGYNLMYDGVDGGLIGSLAVWQGSDEAALNGDYGAGYAAASDWFFQMVFVATAASIVSGALAERIRLWPFFVFVFVLTAVIYPVQGAWTWGGGWLAERGFVDFAGSTVVHSVGGWAALTGAIILGARHGKFRKGGRITIMPASSLPLATIGTFILWLGWLGFNGGSQLAFSSAADAVAISNIYASTTMASAGGVVAAVLVTQLMHRKIDLTMVLSGALAGLVSITASPHTTSIGEAIMIGAIGSVLMIAATILLERLRIDDVVGAIPVHLVAGIWGTLATVLTNPDADLATQLVGIAAIGAFTSAVSVVIWIALKRTVGIRVGEEEEDLGVDTVQLGTKAYPEFRLRSSTI